MKLRYIKLSIEEKKLDFIVLNEYDGVKEAINIENKILLSWFDEKDEYEEWLVLELDDHTMKKYLSKEIGLLSIIQDSQVYLTKRYFRNFNILSNKSKVRLDEIKDGLPLEDIPLDENIYKILFNNIYKIRHNICIQNKEQRVEQQYSFYKTSNYQIIDSVYKYQIDERNKNYLPMVA